MTIMGMRIFVIFIVILIIIGGWVGFRFCVLWSGEREIQDDTIWD